MNAPLSKKMILVAAVAATAALGACSSGLAAKTDFASPLAPRVQALVEANRRYPRWEDFPAAPTGLPDVRQVAGNAQRLQTDRAALNGEIAGIAWTLDDAETLAAQIAAKVEAAPVSPAAARTQAEIEAFAQSLRDRAKAPPPIDRRPAR